MKRITFILILVACSSFEHSTNRSINYISPTTHHKGFQLQEILNRYSKSGIPGVSVAVQQGSQYWQGSSGFANIEQKVPLLPTHLMYAQSLAKTYTAVVTMKLAEEGKLQLDKSIRLYLPENVWKKIEHSEVITVRM